MVNTGDHIIHFYTEKGEKIKNLTEVCNGGLLESKELAKDVIEIERTLDKPIQPVSITIDRRIYNSKDEDFKWLQK